MRALALALALVPALVPAPALALCEGDPSAGADILGRVTCMQPEVARIEAELNALWARVLALHDAPDAPMAAMEMEALHASDAAWRAWREAECRANSEVPRVPQYWELARLQCVHMLTAQRIAYLAELYDP